MQENYKATETDQHLEQEAEEKSEQKMEETKEQSDQQKKESNVDQDAENADAQKEDETEAMQREIEQLKKEKEDTYQRMLRIQAEYENYKKRTQKEKEAERKYKSQDLVQELLPVLDNFERALKVEATEETKSLIDGITMVYNQLQDALKSQGVEVIEAEGKEFDPNIHHAVMQVEEEGIESNIIVEELQKGSMLKDRVVRPAMVKVNK